MSVQIRRCEADDVECLLDGIDAGRRAHIEARWEHQQDGHATFLIAWEHDQPCGQVTLLHRSKYDSVRSRLGIFPEMSGLGAAQQGRGIGSALISAAEVTARDLAATRIGLAVEPVNVGGVRLYQRLGYHEWEHGMLVDRWTERGPGGVVVREHADRCTYLVKQLA